MVVFIYVYTSTELKSYDILTWVDSSMDIENFW